MRQIKLAKSSQKKKRYSQTRHVHGYEHKFTPSAIQQQQQYQNQHENQYQYANLAIGTGKMHNKSQGHGQNHTHNRSQSIGNKKVPTRFKTDYEDYLYKDREKQLDIHLGKIKDDHKGRQKEKDFQQLYVRNNSNQLKSKQKDKERQKSKNKSLEKNYKKTYYSKKRNDTQSFTNKQPFSNNNGYNYSYNYGYNEPAVLSTKSNPRKNLQLRVLFNKTRQGQEMNFKQNTSKGYTAHHPLLKYVSNKNKQYTKSPYTSQIQRFESLYAKMKNSTSKGKRTPSNQKNPNAIGHSGTRQLNFNVNLSLNKNQIKIQKDNTSIPVQPIQIPIQKEEQTVKTIKKQKGNKEKERERQRQRDRQKEREKQKLKQRQKQRQKQKEIQNQREKQKDYRQHTSKSKHSQVEPDSEEEEGYGLTQQEEQTFGNRFPYGFEKVKLLGRGGFSLVWLGRHIKSSKQFAIKQIITQNTHQTHIKQIWFGTTFFTLGGIPKPEFAKFPGIKNLVRMYSYQINQSDTWIFYEKCGNSLGSNLYDIKAERVYGEQRLYKIYYKGFYRALAEQSGLLKKLIIEICKPLVVLSSEEIVHSDLKTQNILIKYQTQGEFSKYKLTETKLIDYGSSFEFKNISQFSMATPEYMPPEILNYIIHENEGEYEEDLYQQVMNNYKNPWIVDIFSLGCVLLQIVVGVPLWMSLPLLVPSKTGNSYCQKQGLFAVKGRLFPQIIQKQRKVIARLDQVLTNENYSKISLSPATRQVIKGMLCIDFNQRISPAKAIQILEAEKDY